MRSLRPSALSSLATAALIAALGWPAPGSAHETEVGMVGNALLVKTRGKPSKRELRVTMSNRESFFPGSVNPGVDGFAFVVSAEGGSPSSSGLIELPSEGWTRKETRRGAFRKWKYRDKQGSAAGVTKAILKTGKLKLVAEGEAWPWQPEGGHDAVWVTVYLEQETYCARFGGSSARIRKNKSGNFEASSALAPASCSPQICGNGVAELPEQCDDGNRDDGDLCRNDCSQPSTFDAIQSVIFEGYDCTNAACHGTALTPHFLDLSAGQSYDQLVGAAASANSELVRVFATDVDQSFLYEKLAAKVEGRPVVGGGSQMPTNRRTLSEDHLEGLAIWIRAGAPREGVVLGSAEKLGVPLPDPVPLKVTPPDPPARGQGVQLSSSAWPLPAGSEGEKCFATFYDFTQTDLVPDAAKIPCPERFQNDARHGECEGDPGSECTSDSDCAEGAACVALRVCYGNPAQECLSDAACGTGGPCITRRNSANPSNECFAWNYQKLVQDPQSHHSIVYVYTGAYDETSHHWGDPDDPDAPTWTWKLDDPADPRNGQPCDPTDIDPALGFNPGCSSYAQERVACITQTPPDLLNFNIAGGGDDGGTLPQFSGSQETFYELQFADKVYTELPMRGLVLWNSHAFNLTSQDSTMNQYLSLEFAEPGEREHKAVQLFDAEHIFTQYVPPFEQEEYCATFTLPPRSRLFRLSSHMHGRGVLWRTWAPPNTRCKPDCNSAEVDFPPLFTNCSQRNLPICAGPRSDEPLYVSTVYNDPLQLDFDPPIALDGTRDERTYLYCARFDNGAREDGPAVKTWSGSPPTPFGAGLRGVGGPCALDERACMAGPNRGQVCGSLSSEDAASFCETAPGAADGVCDACPLRGGVTTEDEMFILLGNYYVLPQP